MTPSASLRGRRVVEGERGRGVDGDRGEVVGDHVVQLPCHPGAFGGDRLGAVHLGEQRGLFGAQPGGLGGVAVVADDPAGGGGREATRAPTTTPISRASGVAAQAANGTRVAATVSSPVIQRDAAGRGGRAVQHGRVHEVGEHQRPWPGCPGVNWSGDERGRADAAGPCAGIVRRSSSQPAITASGSSSRQRRRSTTSPSVGLGVQARAPTAAARRAARPTRDEHVVAVRAGESDGHDSIQHGAARAAPDARGRSSATSKDAAPLRHRRRRSAAGARREPGRVTERSESVIVTLIIVCEVGFWVLLAAGPRLPLPAEDAAHGRGPAAVRAAAGARAVRRHRDRPEERRRAGLEARSGRALHRLHRGATATTRSRGSTATPPTASAARPAAGEAAAVRHGARPARGEGCGCGRWSRRRSRPGAAPGRRSGTSATRATAVAAELAVWPADRRHHG